MGLNNPTTNTAATQFEEDAAPATANLPATASLPAVQQGGAVAVSRAPVNVLTDYKDAMYVSWDSLPAIAASSGRFKLKDGDANLGDEIVIQLMSYQDSWVASPGDTKAPVDLVKWGDTPDVSRDGVKMLDHIENLKNMGWPNAKLQHRCIIAGELVSVADPKGDKSRVGELVQIDLPDSGRKAFNTHQIQTSFAVAKGRKSITEAASLTMVAVAKKYGTNEYTAVTFK